MNINDFNNFSYSNQPKSFSPYKGSHKNRSVCQNGYQVNTTGKESEMDRALRLAKEHHEREKMKRDALEAPSNKNQNDFIQLGQMVDMANDNFKAKSHSKRHTENDEDTLDDKDRISNDQIIENLNKAKEINSKLAHKYDQSSSSDDIISGIINELF